MTCTYHNLLQALALTPLSQHLTTIYTPEANARRYLPDEWPSQPHVEKAAILVSLRAGDERRREKCSSGQTWPQLPWGALSAPRQR
jgi:hypothetical protein